MLKWLIFSIKCLEQTNQSRWNGWQGSSPWAETSHVATSTCYLRVTPVSELCYYSTCCFCWPRLTLQSPASHRSHASLYMQAFSHDCTADSWGQYTGPDGCLPELDVFPSVWCMCFCAEVFFSVLTLYSMEHSLGVTFFFLLPFLMLCCNFLQFPVVLSTPLYVCYVWAGWWLISLVLVTKWQ